MRRVAGLESLGTADMPCTCGPGCACTDGDCGCSTGKCGCASGRCPAKASAGCPCGPTCKCDNGSCGCATGKCCSMVEYPRTGPCEHPPPTCLSGTASGPERRAAAAWIPRRAVAVLKCSPAPPMSLPLSTQVRVRLLLPQVAVHDAVPGRARHGRRRPRGGRYHRHELGQDEVKLKPEGTV